MTEIFHSDEEWALTISSRFLFLLPKPRGQQQRFQYLALDGSIRIIQTHILPIKIRGTKYSQNHYETKNLSNLAIIRIPLLSRGSSLFVSLYLELVRQTPLSS